MFSLFTRPKPDPIYDVLILFLQAQRDREVSIQKQLEVLQTHLEMFKAAPAGQDLTTTPATEDDLLNALELAAEMGNPEASEVIADPDRLREYIRYYRAST
jgi:hypothetical protein